MMHFRRVICLPCHHLSYGALWSCVCRTSSVSTSMTSPSPVNVESFTLNETVVKKDMEALERWNELSQVIDSSRAEKANEKVLMAVEKGLGMLAEMGALNAPIQCETLLLLEATQAHYNLQQFEAALESAERAKNTLLETPVAVRDAALLAEVNQLMAYVLLEKGNIDEATTIFTEVLRWIDVDAKSVMPMQAVAAVNMRRSVVTGIGFCYQKQAEKEVASGGDGKELYGKALDLLIEALSVHIDENDYESVKKTLSTVLKCFEGVNDISQAISTGDKYVSWCRRHSDEAGVAQGTAWLKELQKKYGKEGDTTR
ncbi:hypothetical protein TRSC58_00205 [Trypanosoma rangeli SC58]|uniref:Uncharacterized protein n=1 Tax=Trypanosoma rangeli SC58 TaxID=429131 RepID=A0A061J9D7_TRYRA|nr:hypothetical protein TRSC58_00205 [Trypanosoma rangeli SC58]